MDKQNKISVIVTFKDYYQNFEKCIYSLLNQTYGNIEIAVVNESPDDKKFNKAVKSITMAHPQVEVIGNDVLGDVQYSKHVAAAKFVKGKYVLFLPFAEVLTKNYIFDMVTKMEAEHACVAVSKMAFYFPKETIADLYSYEHQDYAKKKNNYSWAYTFLSGAPTFWGYYYLGNKVIERELLINVMATLPSVDMCNFGCGEDILLSYKIWTAAKNVVLSNEYVVLSWKNEDQLYSDVCSDASYKADKKLCSVVNYILGAVVNNKNIAERELVLKLLRAFVSRYMWRAGWAYEKTALAKAKIYLSDLLGVDDFAFEGEAKKMEDDNKYIDLSSSLDFEEHVSGEYKGKINIYVSMHKDSYVAPNKYLIPIQVGTALAEEEIPGVLHDNTGINISAKNKRYCELTAQYWAWKNVKDADYYGFWHYRRYFAFNLNLETNSWGNVHFDRISNKLLNELNITEEAISKVVPNYDIVIPVVGTCNEGNVEEKITVLEHWGKHLNVNDIVTAMQVISDKFPKYSKYFSQTLADTQAVFCNMFIMKKELFNEYCNFCFGVLEEVERRVDHSKYNVELYRTLGHIAERLVDVYVRYLKDTRKDLKILELPKIVFEDTTPLAKLNKIDTDKKTYVAVALACNDVYMPFTDTLVQSIVENTSKENYYDIVIMHTSISDTNQRICKSIAKNYDNVSIRFLNVKTNFADYADVHVDRHLTVETYFRFMILDLFKAYDKVLYLDCDMIVNDDLAKLFKLDISDNYVAATRDLDFIAACNEPGREEFYQENILKYLNINSNEDYFQAGVILFNVPEISKHFTSKDLFAVALSRNWFYHDQDVLNHLFNGKIYYLEPRWNILSMLENGSHRSRLFKNYLYARYNHQYEECRRSPAVIHYAGIPKPWKDLNSDFADYFWMYARNCPMYERLLQISNEAKMLPNGSLIFYNRNNPADNLGAPLFTIKCNANEWTSTYASVEIMYLADNDMPCKVATLNISSRVVPINGKAINKINRFSFDNSQDWEFFRNNVGYVINPDKSITVWAKYVNIYEGYAWRAMMLESRDLEKPGIQAEEQGIMYEAKPVPADFKIM